MLNFQEIKKEYESKLHKFSRGLLREYLQYQILGIVFNHQLGNKLSFLGGTCLRIVYKLNRFSEDIDFDNKNLTVSEFEELSVYVKKELEKFGYIVELKMLNKGAFHCYIKFPELLYKHGFSPLESEKILIQLDTFDQGVDYETDTFILDKFDLFKQILVTPKDVILSQKLWTITQRSRLKGRDFYDAMYLLQNTKPNKDFLEQKFLTRDTNAIKEIILGGIKDVDWEPLIKDLEPFVLQSEDASRIKLFSDFLKQVEF